MQLALQFNSRNDATFSSYYPGRNAKLTNFLEDNINKNDAHSVHLYGAAGTGKTHLLHAICNLASIKMMTAVYLPLSEHESLDTKMLDNLERLKIVCIDDIQAICGNKEWETAILRLYAGLELNNRMIFITSNKKYNHLSFAVPELQAKLTQGNTQQIFDFTPDEKIKIISRAASNKGLELNPIATKFLLNQTENLHKLFDLLDTLDKASWVNKRKITIPFIKQVLNAN